MPSANQRIIEVKRILTHPTWDAQKISGDLALVELQEPVDIENSNLNTICLGPVSDNIEGSNAEISGWGLLKSGDTAIPDTLQRATVPVVAQSTCKNVYSFVTTITDGEFLEYEKNQ